MKVISIQSSDKGFEGHIKPSKMANFAYSAMLSLSLLSAANADVFTKTEQSEKTEQAQFIKADQPQKAGWWARNGEALFTLCAIGYLICNFPKLLGKSIDNLTIK